MKKFLKKVLISAIILVAAHIGLAYYANGYTDPFYLRFTTPRQSSLILGTSRAAQGIVPEILNNKFSTKSFFNFSFTIKHSPYGRIYQRAIEKKLSSTTDGVFIVTVDPWSICSNSENPNEEKHFRENGSCLDNTKRINYYPNYHYLINNYFDGWLNLLNQGESEMLLHEDGWLEVSLPMDTLSVSERTISKLKYYREKYLKEYKFSNVRFRHLTDIVNMLSDQGKVYIVRLPTHPEMLKIEKELMPDFQNKINKLSENTKVPFINFIDESSRYTYTDGNHLYKESARELTLSLAHYISQDSAFGE